MSKRFYILIENDDCRHNRGSGACDYHGGGLLDQTLCEPKSCPITHSPNSKHPCKGCKGEKESMAKSVNKKKRSRKGRNNDVVD